MDPFAVGQQLSTNPEMMVPQLAEMGPPPAQGRGFTDWLSERLNRIPTQPNAYGNAANPRMGGPFPQAPPSPDDAMMGPYATGNATAPSPLIAPNTGNILPAPPGYTGVENVPGVGPVPTTGIAPEPDLQSGPTPASAITKAPPTLSEQIPLPRPRPAIPAEAPKPAISDAEKQKKIQDAMKGMTGMLAGLKAPPAPATQHISSPGAPRPAGTIQGGGIAALIQQMMGTAPQAAAPLRLGNALYAGGRGLY
jgi:hypothetical protein